MNIYHAPLTREQHMSVVHLALDVLQSRYAVYITGQPVIAKTRASMIYAIQCLLYRQAAEMDADYKSNKTMFFLRREDRTHRVWGASSRQFDDALLRVEKGLVAVTDPPENGPYSSMGERIQDSTLRSNGLVHFAVLDMEKTVTRERLATAVNCRIAQEPSEEVPFALDGNAILLHVIEAFKLELTAFHLDSSTLLPGRAQNEYCK